MIIIKKIKKDRLRQKTDFSLNTQQDGSGKNQSYYFQANTLKPNLF
jgi:hypothetical protein